MEQKIIDIIADLLEKDDLSISSDQPFSEIKGWSSLIHLLLITAFEERFHTEIPMEDIPDIKNMRDLLKYIE